MKWFHCHKFETIKTKRITLIHAKVDRVPNCVLKIQECKCGERQAVVNTGFDEIPMDIEYVEFNWNNF